MSVPTDATSPPPPTLAGLPPGMSEADAAAEQSAVIALRTTRYRVMNVAVAVLAVIAVVAALYLARAFFIPLLLGIFVSYTLSPVVGWLESCHAPRPLAAALVLAVLAGSLSWLTYSLSDGAAAMTENLPVAAQKLRKKLSATRSSSPTALQNMQDTASELEGVAADAGTKPGARVKAGMVPEASSWLRDYALAQTALLVAVLGQAPIVLLLSYFLLASGEHFRRKLVKFVGPSLSRKKHAVRILDEIDGQIQRYLLAMLVTNILVGVATWIAFEALGVEQAGVWGVAAGVLHFIPYLGPAVMAVASGVVALLQFDSVFAALAVAGASLLVAGAIGFAFLTWLQSRLARVNAAVLFIALLFFGWLWGAWGLLLGAPLVAIVKVICDHIEALKPTGELMGH